jgi:hypothetical protein
MKGNLAAIIERWWCDRKPSFFPLFNNFKTLQIANNKENDVVKQ